MKQKISENAGIFLILLCFLSFCWTKRIEPPAADQVGVSVISPASDQVETTWESDYPASLLPGEKINVNTAALSDLERIPSIGALRAEEIYNHRQQNGSFVSVEHLLDVYGIGVATLEGIAPYITLE